MALVDYAFTRNIAVLFMDRLDLVGMPWLRKTVENMFKQGALGRVIERNGEKIIVYAAGKMPGYAAELAARVGVRTAEGVVFLDALERIGVLDAGAADSGQTVPVQTPRIPAETAKAREQPQP